MTRNQLIEQKNQKCASLRGTFDKLGPELMKAIPAKFAEYFPPERLLRIAMTTIRTSKNLWKCPEGSIIAGIMLAAQHGLEIDMRGQAWLVPRKHYGKYQANFQIGYQGYLELVRRTDKIIDIEAHIQYENDSFSYQFGDDPRIDHQPARTNRGVMESCYAIAYFKNSNHKKRYVMEREDIEYIRDQCVKGLDKEDHVWNKWPVPMWKKTTLIQLCKLLPMSYTAQNIIALDELDSAGIDQQLVERVEVPQLREHHEEEESNTFIANDFFPIDENEEPSDDYIEAADTVNNQFDETVEEEGSLAE